MPELFDVHTPPDAWRKFATLFQPALRTERVAVADALDRVLAAPLSAPHDLPDFPRSTVDGYAVAAQDTYGASDGLPALLDVVGEVAMGEAANVRLDEAQCALVHTGGMIPADADAVVMVEHTQRVGGKAEEGKGGKDGQDDSISLLSLFSPFSPFSIEVYRPVAVGQNVIQIGEDVRRGESMLPAGHQMRPQDIGGLLALGIVEIDAAVAPRGRHPVTGRRGRAAGAAAWPRPGARHQLLHAGRADQPRRRHPGAVSGSCRTAWRRCKPPRAARWTRTTCS